MAACIGWTHFKSISKSIPTSSIIFESKYSCSSLKMIRHIFFYFSITPQLHEISWGWHLRNFRPVDVPNDVCKYLARWKRDFHRILRVVWVSSSFSSSFFAVFLVLAFPEQLDFACVYCLSCFSDVFVLWVALSCSFASYHSLCPWPWELPKFPNFHRNSVSGRLLFSDVGQIKSALLGGSLCHSWRSLSLISHRLLGDV